MAKELSSLSVGDTVEVPVKSNFQSYLGAKIVFKVADKNHVGYPSNSVTLITDKLITALCFDAKEPSNSDAERQKGGSDRYLHSNLLQWLNSNGGAGNWYSAQHSADAPPTIANVNFEWNPYDSKAGFLSMLEDDFVNALLNTATPTVRNTVTDGGGYETVTSKMFLASTTEVGLANENNIAEGGLLPLFSSNASRLAYPTTECVSNSDYVHATFNTSLAWRWYLRTPRSAFTRNPRIVTNTGTMDDSAACDGSSGTRPLCNLSSSQLISDTVNSSGNYEFQWNQPPTMPDSITIPDIVRGGKSLEVAWGPSTDPDGNLMGYILDRQINGQTWNEIFRGTNRTYVDDIVFGWSTVAYRVKAYDSNGAESDFLTSGTYDVINTDPIYFGPDTITEVFYGGSGGDPIRLVEGYIGDENNIPRLFYSYGSTIKPFADYTWAEIKEIADAGLAQQYFNVGDEKPITMKNGDQNVVQIVDFYKDIQQGTVGNRPIIPMTLRFKHLLPMAMQINSTPTNSGGFSGSEIWTNVFHPTSSTSYLGANLPDDFKAAVKQARKDEGVGGTSSTLQTGAYFYWMPAASEIWGPTVNAPSGEGDQYEIFKIPENRFMTVYGSDDRLAYWTRSPDTRNAAGFFIGYDSPNPGTSSANTYERYVPIMFCI